MISRYINILLHLWNTYNKPRVDLLQNLLFVQSHPFPIAFLDSLLFEFLTRVHFPCRSHLTCTDFPEPSLPQYPVHSKCVFCDWLTEKKNWFFKFKIHANKKTCIIFRISHICNFYPSFVFSMPISLDKLWGRKHTLSFEGLLSISHNKIIN